MKDFLEKNRIIDENRKVIEIDEKQQKLSKNHLSKIIENTKNKLIDY